MGKRDFDVDSG